MDIKTLLGDRPVRRVTRLTLLVVLVLAALTALFEPKGGYEILRGILASVGVEVVPYREIGG